MWHRCIYLHVSIVAIVFLIAAGCNASGDFRLRSVTPTEPERIRRLCSIEGSLSKHGEHSAPIPNSNGDVVLLDDSGKVRRIGNDAKAKWSVVLEGYMGGVRPANLLADADRIYITDGCGVTALSTSNGAVLWRSLGEANSMLLSGNLLLAATESGFGESIKRPGRWVLARNVETGAQAFRIALPSKDFNIGSIQENAGLFLIESVTGGAFLFDRKGTVLSRLDSLVIAIEMLGDARLVLTGREVLRLSPTGKIEWSNRFRNSEWIGSGDFVHLPGGGYVAFIYCGNADSGVQIMRFDPALGGRCWEVTCYGLGVTHSGYNHNVNVEQIRDKLRVISRGSGGMFVEILDLATGKSVQRETSRD